jgi:outer membrane protein
MPLYRPQNWDALSQAKLAVQSADAQLAQARQDLILRVTQAYFDVLAAQDALTALEASKKATAEQLAQARREFEVGTKTIVDTHEAQARFDQIAAQEAVARGDLIVKRNALRAIIGRDAGDSLLPLRDAPQLTPPQPADVEAWAKRAEEASYGVAIARAAAEIARIETTRSRHGHYPTLDLAASVSQSRTSGSLTSDASNTLRDSRIGVQLNIPLYAGGLIQSRVREALANEERARFDLESARRNAAQGARQAYTGVDFGLAQVRALESAEVSAKSQLDSTQLGYQVGVRINLDVLNAQTQLFNTQRDLKKARYDFLVNGLRLKSAAGALDEKDLEAINALLAR